MLFAHAYYFDYVGDRQMAIGYLALYTAKQATGPWTETKLFGWPSSSPISSQGVAYNIATTDIRLLRSLDHGKTWSFVSTLLAAADGPRLGSESNDITGADLFYADGAYHLIASPFGTIQGPGGETFSGYHGCVVVATEVWQLSGSGTIP